MTETRSLESTITIDAAVADVWRALTDAEELIRWFPLQAEVEPGVGGRMWLSWNNEFSDDSVITVWEPNRHLRTEWPLEGAPLPLVTDYYLESEGGGTVLRVVGSQFSTDPSWDGWYDGTRMGWHYELRSLKHYLERHRGEDRHVVCLKHSVPLPRPTVWRRIVDGLDADPPPDTLEEGAPIQVTNADGKPASGRIAASQPPHQLAIVIDGSDALLRFESMPTSDSDRQDLTVWQATYGLDEATGDAWRKRWTSFVGRVLPEAEPRP